MLKLSLNDKQRKGILFCLLFVVGIQTFYIAMYGFSNTPFYDAESGFMRCPDWRFHVCYAECLDVEKCSWNYAYPGFEEVGGKANYDFYMPLVHFASGGLALLSGLSVLFWLAFIASASLVLLIALLWKHSGGGLGAVAAISSFILVIPLAMLVLFNNPAFTWIDLTICGLVTFLVACALFSFLLLEARNLNFKWAFLVFVLITLSHNYGFALALFALGCLAVEFYSKQRLKATWIAIAGVFTWIVFFSPHYFTYGSERIIFLLYFLVSLEVGRLISERVKK